MDGDAVAVLTEVAALDRSFDYRTRPGEPVEVGDLVRVDLQGRSVRAWVVGPGSPEVAAKAIRRRLGAGPPAPVVALCEWAARRYHGPRARLLLAASPGRLVRELEPAPRWPDLAPAQGPVEPGVVLQAPTTDPLEVVLGAAHAARQREGSLLVLAPSEGWSERLAARLERRGLAVARLPGEWARARSGWPVVVGARGAALAPIERLGAAVVLDAEDEAYRSESAPTWEATAVVAERCRREGAPLWLTTMIASPTLAALGPARTAGEGASGWPRVVVADRRERDPRDGALLRTALDEAHRALRGEEAVAVAVVHQRLGAGRLMVCARCGEVARCALCQRPEQSTAEGLLCDQGHGPRPAFCQSCGATRLRAAAIGVATLARQVAAQLGCEVSEVDAKTDPAAPLARVVVGTEAVLHRVRRAGLVIFSDFDQYLLAPRESARRRAVVATGRAGRLVGSRREGRGAVVLQTRRAEDLVVGALVAGEVEGVAREDDLTAAELGWPPYGALADLSGPGAAQLAEDLAGRGLWVGEGTGEFHVRAPHTETLLAALEAADRPGARVRVAVH